MRNAKEFCLAYSDQVLLSKSGTAIAKEARDTALVDLCLHFLAIHFDSGSVDAIPGLLQGHLENHCPPVALKPLFTLRQIASKFCSRLAWRNALSTHKTSQSRTAYLVVEGRPQRQKPENDFAYGLLGQTLLEIPPYETRELKFATTGDWVAWIRSQETVLQYTVPKISLPSGSPLDLKHRGVNPPIQIRWQDLLDTAIAVDARESHPNFPTWLPKLELHSRLQRIGVECFDNIFFKDGVFTLSGTQHVVGMLSSGKSTLFLALLFLLVRPGYDKTIVILTSDTASASRLIARLKAHGIDDSTVISSFRNREEHISAAHWSTSGYPADQRLLAAAAITESLGIACPLEGLQAVDRDAVQQEDRPLKRTVVPKLSEKPCHGLGTISAATKGVKASAIVNNSRTCPLIQQCPAHAQQHRLAQAKVIAMTPQAFLAMTPEKSVVRENISFPELFQYAADVVLIDEADSVQQTFDQQCLQDEGLIASGSGSFLPEHQRLMANSLQDRLGSQYARAATVRWQSAFTRLQGAVAMVYFLILRHQADLQWITKSGTFTAASIFCDLWSSGKENSKQEAERSKILEQIAILAGALYSDVAEADDSPTEDVTDAIKMPEFLEAFRFLKTVQRELLERGSDDSDDGPLEKIQGAINSGPLRFFAGKNEAKRRAQQAQARTSAPDDSIARAHAVALALLTNVTLSSFGYLVRNQAAVEDEFRLTSESLFMTARRLMTHYGAIIPRPLYGTVFGLIFEHRGEAESGGALKLVNHLGVGRYLLTNLHRLLGHEGQAGPHVLLMSGTSWAGGDSPTASPRFDVQCPVSAVLKQPEQETSALARCQFEFVSLGSSPIPVSGQPPEVRRDNLRKISTLLGQINPAGTRIFQKWKSLADSFKDDAIPFSSRHRALLVTNNYRDAKVVANAFAQACGNHHIVYCLVPDDVAKADGLERRQSREAEPYSHQLVLLPRSRVETFGQAPSGSVLVAPIEPVSRGHNIVTDEGFAAISSIYFLHRPHPRPDEMKGVVGAVNRFTMDWINNGQPSTMPIEQVARKFESGARRALDEGFALRTSYKTMSAKARTQYSWDLITQLWQTVGRGIRGGVPVYVGFVDERFAPQTFAGEPHKETSHSSCLIQCRETLKAAVSEGNHAHLAQLLYSPFLEGLQQLFPKASDHV